MVALVTMAVFASAAPQRNDPDEPDPPSGEPFGFIDGPGLIHDWLQLPGVAGVPHPEFIDPLEFGAVSNEDGVWDLRHLPTSPPRWSHTLVYDPKRDRVILFGGAVNRNGQPYDSRANVFALSLADPVRWEEIQTVGEVPPRGFTSAIYDPVRDRMIVYGGATGTSYYGDVWALSLADPPTWTRLYPSGGGPGARGLHSAVYDRAGDRMIVVGGADQSPLPPRTSWALDLSSLTWSLVPGHGEGNRATDPEVVWEQVAIYDDIGHREVIYGGWRQWYSDFRPKNQVWIRSLETPAPYWRQDPSAPAPPAPLGPAGIYDRLGRRLLVSQDAWLSEGAGTWSLDLTADPPAWKQLHPLGSPFRSYYQAAVYDPVRYRMIVNGGWYNGQFATGETHVLYLLFPLKIDVRPYDEENVIPYKASGAVRVALLGSEALDATTVDPAGVEFAGAPVQRQLGVPKTELADVNGDGFVDLVMWFEVNALDLAPGDTVATMTAQLPGDRLGGRGSDRVRVVPPHLMAPAVAEDGTSSGASGRVAIEAVRERGGAIQVAFRLAGPGEVSLELLDVAGRRMAGIRPGWIAAGSHDADMAPAVLTPGVYFVRLRQGGVAATRRVVWMR